MTKKETIKVLKETSKVWITLIEDLENPKIKFETGRLKTLRDVNNFLRTFEKTCRKNLLS